MTAVKAEAQDDTFFPFVDRKELQHLQQCLPHANLPHHPQPMPGRPQKPTRADLTVATAGCDVPRDS
jgi:hypothetical protein